MHQCLIMIIACFVQICDFLLSAALTGGNTALDALADSGSDAPPLPGNIKGIMEDLRGQPEPDQAQPASTEGRHADTGTPPCFIVTL